MSLCFSGHGQIEKFKRKPQFFLCRQLKAYWCQVHPIFVNFYYLCNGFNIVPRDMVAKFVSKNILASISCCALSNGIFSINANWTCYCKNKSSELQNSPATTSHSTAHLSTRKKTEVEISFSFSLLFLRSSIFLYFTSRNKEANAIEMSNIIELIHKRNFKEDPGITTKSKFLCSSSQWT